MCVLITYQALNLDADSNLWVAGGHAVTKVFTDPYAISDGTIVTATPASPPLLQSTTTHAPVDIYLDSTYITYPAVDSVPECSYWSPNNLDDTWDTGVVISRGGQNMVYIANTAVVGKVPFIPSYICM